MTFPGRPYPYFGSKAAIMPLVWKYLGDPPHLIDPFLGSNAPLLSRPGWDWAAARWSGAPFTRLETVNDKNGYIANFWRATTADPQAVAEWTNWPVNENDLHARHAWLTSQAEFLEKINTDPHYYDPKIAGWWVWGQCAWLGRGWCQLPDSPNYTPHLTKARPHLTNAGQGVHRPRTKADLPAYFEDLKSRLAGVRICCGDWRRVVSKSIIDRTESCAIILDPPYGDVAKRDYRLYSIDDYKIANEVRDWSIEQGDKPDLKIALFGYEIEHFQAMPDNWECVPWRAVRRFAARGKGNGSGSDKERVWFSPHCLRPEPEPGYYQSSFITR